jgi:uncharacterized membrane protein YfcA
VGLVTGVVGAGGGFLIVPALVLLGGVPMANAVATSLLVISLNCGAGLVTHLPATTLDWPLTIGVAATTVAGSLAGASLCGRVPAAWLRTAFGWLVLALGAVILVLQLRSWDSPAAIPLIITGAVALGLTTGASLKREPREMSRPHRR